MSSEHSGCIFWSSDAKNAQVTEAIVTMYTCFKGLQRTWMSCDISVILGLIFLFYSFIVIISSTNNTGNTKAVCLFDNMIITQTFTMARWQIAVKMSEATKQRPNKQHNKKQKQKKQNKQTNKKQKQNKNKKR